MDPCQGRCSGKLVQFLDNSAMPRHSPQVLKAVPSTESYRILPIIQSLFLKKKQNKAKLRRDQKKSLTERSFLLFGRI